MNETGVVAALGAEARTLGPTSKHSDGFSRPREGLLAVVSGMGSAAAECAAERLTQAGVAALLSWGMAGGLDPSLPAGTLCVPQLVTDGEGARFTTDRIWRQSFTAAIAAERLVTHATLLSHGDAVDSVVAKAAWFARTAAVAVDMESAAVAKVAALHGLPFLVVRAIVDTAADSLPDAVKAASHTARLRLMQLLLGIMRSPGDLVPIMRLSARYRVALLALRSVASSGAGALRARPAR